MKRTKYLGIITVLIAVLAVISMTTMCLESKEKPPEEPLKKGVYVSGGDKKMYVIDPDTMEMIASKDVGQSSMWPSNQYEGDEYIWLPGGGSQGLTIINSVNLEVVCKTGYGSNWVEITPGEVTPDSLAMVTTLKTDTISRWKADISNLGCPPGPIKEKVYDTTKHDGPCDMTISPDGQDMWIPDLDSGKNLGIGFDSVTGIKVNDLQDQVIYYMPRCKDDAPLTSFMTTISPDPDYPYVFVENFESLVSKNSGSESVVDISDFRNPKEVVRFVQDKVLADMAKYCPNGYEEDGKYYLDHLSGPGRTELKGGLGLNPYSDEFVPGKVEKFGKLNFLNQYSSGDLAVVDIAKLEIIKTIALPAGSKPGTGDFSRDGKKYFVSTDKGKQVCRIDVTTLSLDTCVNIGTSAKGVVVK